MPTSLPRSQQPAIDAERRVCRRWPEATYYLAAPSRPAADAPVLVSVHGISRNAREHAETFASFCDRLGWYVVAPEYTEEAHPKFQQLGYSSKRRGPRPDLALNAILDEVAATTGADTRRIFLFGFSGGGQFAHRYAMLHPRRVAAAVLGAPGWYTFPVQNAAYPRGLARIDEALAADIDLTAFLRIPVLVLVGSRDNGRDEALNASAKIDDEQGLTRQERGRRWIEALSREAAGLGIAGRHEYGELAGCGHSFTDCVNKGRMDAQALDFFIRSQRGGRARATHEGTNHSPTPALFLR